MSRVLVTGATGFVGRHLITDLASTGVDIVAAGRSAPRRLDAPANVVSVHLDLTRPEDFSESMFDGVSSVYHLAAFVHVMHNRARDEAAFMALNAQATEQLARKAARAGVRRFVYVSSIKVNGEGTLARPFTAEDPPAPRDSYARSKLKAEQALAEVAASTGLETVVVRPPLVYGSHVGANFLRLMALVHSGLPLPLASANNRRSLVSVWNLVSFLKLVGTDPRAAGLTWLVSDGRDVSTVELLSAIAAAMGRKLHLWSIPSGVLRVGAALAGKSGEISRLLDSLEVDISRTRTALKWQPPVTFEQGIARTVAWFKELKCGCR